MALGTTTLAVLTAASVAVSAVGMVAQGQAAKKQANFSAEVARQQAERERLEAANREQDFRRQQSRLMASRRAMLGASGVEAGEGSPLMVSEDIAGEVELQAQRIRNGGEVRATRLNQQASLFRAQGRSAATGGFFRAGATILSGASKFGSGGGGVRPDPAAGGVSDPGATGWI